MPNFIVPRECSGVCGIDIDGGLERHSRFGETLGQRAKDAEIVVRLSVLGFNFDQVAIRRFRPRRLTYTGINWNRINHAGADFQNCRSRAMLVAVTGISFP